MCVPLLAYLCLCFYESNFLDNITSSDYRKLPRSFNLCFRCINDSKIWSYGNMSKTWNGISQEPFCALRSVMARFLAFFTLFHLSLTFFRPEVPFNMFFGFCNVVSLNSWFIHSKMAAVLIFNNAYWFWQFFTSEPLLPWQQRALYF